MLAKLDCLLSMRVSTQAARSLLGEVGRGALQLQPFSASDVERAAAVIDAYRDLHLGLADASLVVLAERHGTRDVLTLDERRFRAVRGPGGQAFRLLPADA